MSKNILIISASFRKGGNSDLLSNEFIKGAREAGHQVEKIYLTDKKMEFCRGCLVCQTTGKCIIKDDIAEVLEKMRKVDVIVFTTPIYYYEMSGQMKTFLDRSNPLFPGDYNFKDIYYILTAADENEESTKGPLKGLDGWIYCFEQAKLSGTLFAGGVTDKADIEKFPAKLKEAYEMGKSVK
ncbi:flavodoxin family protein [Terrisporobacter sp.]